MAVSSKVSGIATDWACQLAKTSFPGEGLVYFIF